MSGLEPEGAALKVVQGGGEPAADPNEIAMEAFGVRIGVSAAPTEVLDHVRPFLPPGWKACPSSAVQQRFGIRADGTGTYEFLRNGRVKNEGLGLELAVGLLDTEVRRRHAVLGNDGLAHPYAKSLSLRESGDHVQVEHSVDALGGVAGEDGLPLGAVVVTSYKPDAQWQPEYLSPGEGAMALLANAVPARERPEEAMRALSRCADGAVVVMSDRSEADVVARWLMAELDWSSATPSP